MAAVTARCRDTDCPGSQQSAEVEIPEVAPGILDVPNLRCAVCGYECRTEPAS